MIPARIAVIGGSNVFGQGDPAGGGFVARLSAWHQPKNDPINSVFNLGVSGETVAQISARAVVEATCRRPDLIILYPGLNDLRRANGIGPTFTGFEELTEQIRQLLGRLQKICPVILMSTVPVDESRSCPYYRHWFYRREDVVRLAQINSAIAKEMAIPYFDIYERWVNRTDLTDIMADGLHCNGRGHQLVFEELKAFLELRFNTES